MHAGEEGSREDTQGGREDPQQCLQDCKPTTTEPRIYTNAIVADTKLLNSHTP